MNNYYSEIDEAIEAGRNAIEALTDAEEYLSSAKGWGLFDMLGGGFISGLIKHSKLDKAQQCMNEAKYQVSRFSKELQDVDRVSADEIKCDGLAEFFDLFCDGFLVDLVIQSKISSAMENVRTTRRKIENAVDQLRSMRYVQV